MESLSLPTHNTHSPAGDLVDIMSPPSSSSPAAGPQHYLKLEDLHSSTSNDDSSAFQTSPPPVIVHSKQAKKRKSWGQELPEPKTSLPPRKRAKTEDEKEQRRIERIKRNRAAAHNSRERKRQETETLAVALARANAELDAYRRLHGPLPASVVLPEVTLSLDSPDTPAPSLIESTGSIDAFPSPRSPPEHTFHVDVPIKQEMTDSVLPAALLSNPQQSLESRSVQPSRLDPTQHSAAMLCDLQCRSTRVRSSTHISPSSPHHAWWMNLFLYMMTLQLQTFYKTTLLAIWSHSPSRMARWMQASTRRLTSRSTTSFMTPRLSRSMAMAQLNAATGRVSALRQQSLTRSRRAGSDVATSSEHLLNQRKAFEEQSGTPEQSNLGSGDENGNV